MNKKVIYDHLASNNDYQYNLIKAAEECQELALILLQKVNKPTKVRDKQITDEIGDVKIRLNILDRLFNKEEIRKRVDTKLATYRGWIDNKSYKNI